MTSQPAPSDRAQSRACSLLRQARAVLFDLDGTLIETHIDFGLMRREMLRLSDEAGASPENAEQLDILALVESTVHRIAARDGVDAANAFRTKAFALLERIEEEHCASPEELPGARRLLEWLASRGIAVGIVTRNSRSVSERLLSVGRLPHDVLLTREDVVRTKPHPDHLLLALERLSDGNPGHSRLRPEEAVMLGDHWMDIQAGRAAGCPTIGLLRGRSPEFFDRAMPDVLVDSISELAECVDRHHGPP